MRRVRAGRWGIIIGAIMPVAVVTGLASKPVAAAPVWEPAEEVGIDASLAAAWTYATLGDLECATANDCVAVGTAGWSTGGPFVATKSGGSWADAVPVPDGNNLHDGSGGGATAVQCVSAGNCAVVGSYSPSGNQFVTLPMTAMMVDGTWGDMNLVPGTDGFHDNGTDPQAASVTISCSPDGATCVLGGVYRHGPSANHYSGFVASLGAGASWGSRSWGTAIEVPGLSGLNTGDNARVTRVDCPAANVCVAVGTVDVGPKTNGFITEFDGTTWTNATIVPGLDALNSNATSLEGLDCAAAGECVIAGRYADASASWTYEGFVAVQSNGFWGNATAIPGLATLRAGSTNTQDPSVRSVSCPAAGECAVVGSYVDNSGAKQVFVIEQNAGNWGTATKLDWSSDLLSASAGADFTPSIECPAAGECMVTGTYRATSPSTAFGAYIATQTGGVWGDITALPNASGLNATRTNGDAVDCTAPGACVVAGTFLPGYKLYVSSMISSLATTTTTTVPPPPPPPTTTLPPTITTPTTPPTVAPATTVPAPVVGPSGEPTDLEVGVGEALVDGEPTPVEIVVENQDRDLVLRTSDLELRLAAQCSSACPISTDAEGRHSLQLDRDGSVAVEGTGFAPGTLAQVWLFSEPRLLGTALVDVDGSFAATFPIGEIELGEHTLQVSGTGADGSVRAASLGVVVADLDVPAPPVVELPSTGTAMSGLVIMLLALALGVGLVGFSKRRDRSSAPL